MSGDFLPKHGGETDFAPLCVSASLRFFERGVLKRETGGARLRFLSLSRAESFAGGRREATLGKKRLVPCSCLRLRASFTRPGCEG